MIDIKTFKDNGVVVAEITDTEYDVGNVMDKLVEHNCKLFRFNYRGVAMPNSFKGVAKLFPDDVFDEKLGADIAKSKCIEKYHKSFDKRVLKALKDVRSLEKALVDYCDKKGILHEDN